MYRGLSSEIFESASVDSTQGNLVLLGPPGVGKTPLESSPQCCVKVYTVQ